MQKTMTVIYTIMSTLMTIMTALSYYKKKHAEFLIKFGYCILIPRILVRGLDLEGTRDHMSIGDWHSFHTMNSIGSFASIIIFMHNFESSTFHRLISILYTVGVVGMSWIGNYEYDELKVKYIQIIACTFIQSCSVLVWFRNQNFERSIMKQM
jgi:hypothetical protein